MALSAWLSDLPGVQQIVNGLGATDVVLPRRARLRFVPGSGIADNPFKKSTDIGVGLGGGAGSGGDVVGPAGATNNAFARFDTTTGKLVKSGLVTADDAGNITTPGRINGVHIGYSDVDVEISANTQDLTFAGLDGADVIRATFTGAWNLGGIVTSGWKKPWKVLVNVGSNTGTLVNQDGGSTAANRFLLSSAPANYSLPPNTFVFLYKDEATGRIRVTTPGAAGGGGENIAATLGLGNNAGGASIVGLGVLSSQGELAVQQAGQDILTTASGSTILRCVSAGFTLKKAANDLLYVNENGTTRTELYFSAFRALAYLSVATPADGHGIPLRIQAGAFGGTGDKNGGRVQIQGTPHLGAGAVGGVDVLRTTGALLAAFNDAGVSISGALDATSLVVSGGATVGSLVSTSSIEAQTTLAVRGLGVGTPVALSGDIRCRSAITQLASRNNANTQDLALVSTDASDAVFLGGTLNPSTLVRAGTSVQFQTANVPRMTIYSGGNAYVGISTATLSFETGVSTPYFSQIPHGSSHGGRVSLLGQSGFQGGNTNGGQAMVAGGRPGGTGLRGGSAMAWSPNAGALQEGVELADVGGGRKVAFCYGAPVTTAELPANTGDRVIAIAVAATAPTAAPLSGCIVWWDGTNLKIWKSGAGSAVNII